MLSVETKHNQTWVGLFRFLNNTLITMLCDTYIQEYPYFTNPSI